ncbi:hypothetical protein CCP3SC1_1370003 [Gammaproteobacteria bacterium]
MNEDNKSASDNLSTDGNEPVKNNPLSPKWYAPKSAEPAPDISKVETVAVETTVTSPPPSTPEEVVAPAAVETPVEPQPEAKEPEAVSPPAEPAAVVEEVKEAAPVVTPPAKPVAEDGQLLKTMSDIASKAIEKGKSSLSRFEHRSFSKKQENVTVATTGADKVSPPPLRESFVTTAEKEQRLKDIREAAAQKIERNKAARIPSFGVTAPPVDEKKPEEVAVRSAVVPLSSSPVEVVVAELVAPEAAVVTVVSEVIPPETAAAPAEIASANLDVLVPPPPRLVVASSHSKPEIRSAAQARINEAYLRKLKGEDPEEAASAPEPKSPAASVADKPNEDGLREISVEDLGTGIFNALGDMVGGVVHLTRVLGGGIKNVVVANPLSSQECVSGTARMAQGVREMVTGVKEIAKGGGSIVIGTVGAITTPVIGVINSIKSSGKSEPSDT